MHFLDGEGEKSERRRSPPDRPPPMNNSWSCSVDEWTTIIIGKLKKSFGPEQPKPSITPFLLSDTTRTSTTRYTVAGRKLSGRSEFTMLRSSVEHGCGSRAVSPIR